MTDERTAQMKAHDRGEHDWGPLPLDCLYCTPAHAATLIAALRAQNTRYETALKVIAVAATEHAMTIWQAEAMALGTLLATTSPEGSPE